MISLITFHLFSLMWKQAREMFFKFLVLYITQQLHMEQIINLNEYFIWMAIHEVCILLRTLKKINIQLHTIFSGD